MAEMNGFLKSSTLCGPVRDRLIVRSVMTGCAGSAVVLLCSVYCRPHLEQDRLFFGVNGVKQTGQQRHSSVSRVGSRCGSRREAGQECPPAILGRGIPLRATPTDLVVLVAARFDILHSEHHGRFIFRKRSGQTLPIRNLVEKYEAVAVEHGQATVVAREGHVVPPHVQSFPDDGVARRRVGLDHVVGDFGTQPVQRQLAARYDQELPLFLFELSNHVGHTFWGLINALDDYPVAVGFGKRHARHRGVGLEDLSERRGREAHCRAQECLVCRIVRDDECRRRAEVGRACAQVPPGVRRASPQLDHGTVPVNLKLGWVGLPGGVRVPELVWDGIFGEPLESIQVNLAEGVVQTDRNGGPDGREDDVGSLPCARQRARPDGVDCVRPTQGGQVLGRAAGLLPTLICQLTQVAGTLDSRGLVPRRLPVAQ
mmetsp:Transcript_9020/g.24287  ORF Transcript_9020/g.24287 Transcript_9020/m.24287 type:complete len:427 (-) Transcript_9020:66-1346(-)